MSVHYLSLCLPAGSPAQVIKVTVSIITTVPLLLLCLRRNVTWLYIVFNI